MAGLYRLNFDQVLKIINDAGCEYVSGAYENYNSVLTYKCSCGNIFSRDFAHFARGQNTCEVCSRKRVADSKRHYDQNLAKEILISYGYNMIGEFTGAANPVSALCKNGHSCNIILSQLLHGKSGCMQCAKEQKKGSNSYFYIDGRAKIQDAFRASLDQWRKDISARYRYTCPITGRTGMDCDVHHIKPLREIFSEVSSKYNINLKMCDSINQITDYNLFDTIRKGVIEAHTLDTGIFISSGIHRLFHKLYGITNETEEDFDEFLQQYFNTSIAEIQFKNPAA